jgi:hypothetical protein
LACSISKKICWPPTYYWILPDCLVLVKAHSTRCCDLPAKEHINKLPLLCRNILANCRMATLDSSFLRGGGYIDISQN